MSQSDTRVSRNLRLPIETAQEVEIVARIDEMSGNELITIATEEYLTRRGNSKAFRKRLAERHESERELYERLAVEQARSDAYESFMALKPRGRWDLS